MSVVTNNGKNFLGPTVQSFRVQTSRFPESVQSPNIQNPSVQSPRVQVSSRPESSFSGMQKIYTHENTFLKYVQK